jgi:hypothetical protein
MTGSLFPILGVETLKDFWLGTVEVERTRDGGYHPTVDSKPSVN